MKDVRTVFDSVSDFSFIKAPIDMFHEEEWVYYRLTDAYTNCGLEDFVDLSYEWCMTNPGTCLYGEKMIDRLFDNRVKIVRMLVNFWNYGNQLSSCSTDMEKLDELEQVIAGLSWMTSVFLGFTWDGQPESTHLDLTTMQTNLELRKIEYIPYSFVDYFDEIVNLSERMLEF